MVLLLTYALFISCSPCLTIASVASEHQLFPQITKEACQLFIADHAKLIKLEAPSELLMYQGLVN